MTKKDTRRGLGRGLSALMADVEPTTIQGDASPRADRSVPIEQIVPNPDQPRRSFTEDQLKELAESIRTKGVIQPLIVRPDPAVEGRFQIVAGERRWRAAQMAKLHELPILVRNFDDTEVLEVAIVENIQRADLNAIEEAMGYRQLMDKFGHTQDKMAEALGKSRSHIANLLRLLNLPDPVRTLVVDGKLSAGHARAILTADEPEALARTVVAKGLSVRETERLAKTKPGQSPSKDKAGKRKTAVRKDADTEALEKDLSLALGFPVVIDHDVGTESGSVTIRYDSLDALDDLCSTLTRG